MAAMTRPRRRHAIACDLGALHPVERARRAELSASLHRRALRVEEEPGGYRIHLPDDPEVQREALELIQLERRCCPFLTLELGFGVEHDQTVFRVGGGPGVKDFLRETAVLGCAGVPEDECTCA